MLYIFYIKKLKINNNYIIYNYYLMSYIINVDNVNVIPISLDEIIIINNAISNHINIKNNFIDFTIPKLYQDIGIKRRKYWLECFYKFNINTVACIYQLPNTNTRYYWYKTYNSDIYEIIGDYKKTLNIIDIHLIIY